MGIPLILLAPVLLFAGLMAVFSDAIYRLDMKSIYGRVMNKLEELIADMEELRA
jgi:hypothetical protein